MRNCLSSVVAASITMVQLNSLIDEAECGHAYRTGNAAVFEKQIGHFDRPPLRLYDIGFYLGTQPSSLLNHKLLQMRSAGRFELGKSSQAKFNWVIHDSASCSSSVLLPDARRMPYDPSRSDVIRNW